ncbi:succinyl-diaminopimelate desuccinylase [Kordiimonas sp. SCSIO 12603]|uniref:succinyl-diaminopimelate desuccinylase n=1 Tax=Kordiimonas sp. SCSIO 12603 TaxID=2829596 RepID=UPI002101DBC7|nr:succinyl-diaminopimelate desuccinylase [Kordiimonas sp. SCSIO 12603]UTW58525.1 succinyl-diaminopimelate desuccinylase [Kordiimonas sp. SCSIO 12603]
MAIVDALELSQALIRHESVTPDKGDALDTLAYHLEKMGFTCHKMVFEEEGTDPVPNLYARLGTSSPNFCFAGHTDVVPVGAANRWSVDPFAAEVKDGQLWGRGASDMKAAIASFVSAVSRFLDKNNGEFTGSLSLLITGDEEGPAVNGTTKVLDWMVERGEKIDLCLVGEPTNPQELGQMIKVGRRGSLHGMITVDGTQGHVAYPNVAHNPIPDMVKVLAELNKEPLDAGNERFQPSNLEIVNVHVGNESHNVIPAEAHARFNVRFNNEFTPESLQAELIRRMDRAGVDYKIDWWLSGDSFLTPECSLSTAVADAAEKHTGRRPELSTTGGTSDARFIKNMCPVVEFGLVGATMHKIDEHVAVSDIETITDIYEDVINTLVK